MKDCPDCITFGIQQDVLKLTYASWEGKIAECRRLNHVPFQKLKDRDLCVQCLSSSYATMRVLADQLAHPVDLSGRPLRFASDDATKGGVWALRVLPKTQRVHVVYWIAFLVFLASLAGLSVWLLSVGSHL